MGNESAKIEKEQQETFKATYGVSENEFKIISTTFKKQAKNGQIQRKDFVKVMTKHGGMGEELANQLFDSFDTDNSGTMDINEYLALMGVTFGGTVQQKLRASFAIFDKDGNGSLSKDEVRDMLRMVIVQVMRAQFRSTHGKSAAKSATVLDAAANAKIDQVVEEVFDRVDKDKSGSIDIDEFEKGFSENPEMLAFFKQF